MNRPFIAVATALALTCLAGTNTAAAAGPVKKTAAKAKTARAEPTLPAADSDQLAAAGMTLVGDYQCELNQSVQVAMNLWPMAT
ncbi:MAG: hypothetical protein C4K60_16265 [Ideonella sp. MAG2]|nr:MAG: hypothetical protein C4K60_16265 [Ideonella sp. MAG2]